MRDSVKLGITADLLGTVGDDLIHWPAYLILGTTTTPHYILELVFPYKSPSAARLLTGEVVHYFSGAFIGIVLVMIFWHFGFDHPYYKGVGLGALLWIIHVAIIPNIVAPRPYLLRTELETLIDLIAHITYGAIATIYLTHAAIQQKPEPRLLR